MLWQGDSNVYTPYIFLWGYIENYPKISYSHFFDMFRHGAEEAESEAPPRPKRQSAFRGSGYRLGETEEEATEIVHGGPMSAAPKKVICFLNSVICIFLMDKSLSKGYKMVTYS